MFAEFSTEAVVMLLGAGALAGVIAWLGRSMIASRQTDQLVDEKLNEKKVSGLFFR